MCKDVCVCILYNVGLCVSVLYLACIHSGLTALSLKTKQLQAQLVLGHGTTWEPGCCGDQPRSRS